MKMILRVARNFPAWTVIVTTGSKKAGEKQFSHQLNATENNAIQKPINVLRKKGSKTVWNAVNIVHAVIAELVIIPANAILE